MKSFRSLFLVAGILLSATAALAQDDSSRAKPAFKLGLNYNSHLNFYGRTDSLRSSGVFPLAEFWLKDRFFINAAPVFVNNARIRMEYAGTVASMGYQHLTEKWLTLVTATKPFYTRSAQLVQLALKAQGALSVSRLTPVVNVTLGGDVKWSNRLDFGATAGLDHVIRLQGSNGGVLVLDPGVYAYAGTQQFSRTYSQKNRGSILFPGGSEEVTEQVQRFSILAYEAMVPVIWAKGRWQLVATPAFVVPKNLITVPGRPDLSERGKDLFYLTVGVKQTF
ncbi:MAG TPA: hypothetical protein VHK69_13485 [Chitinophagaceae bacterium]|nr:hypothetical protein [Chitinophagaceae bacterium]